MRLSFEDVKCNSLREKLFLCKSIYSVTRTDAAFTNLLLIDSYLLCIAGQDDSITYCARSGAVAFTSTWS